MLLRARPVVVVVALLAAALALSSSCKRDVEPLPVRKVLVDVLPGAEGPGRELEREKLRVIVERAVDEDARMKRTEAREGASLRVILESAALVPPDEGSTASGTLSVTVEVAGAMPDHPLKRYEYRGHSMASLAVSEAAPAGLDFTALFKRAFDDALAQVLVARGAAGEDSDVLLAWLESEKASAAERHQAIRVLGARKDARAVPALMKALLDDDEELAGAALGALTLIGDARAAPAIIEYAEGKPKTLRKKQAIEALRVSGAPLAKAWLFTISTGHPDADLRASAERALAALEQRPVDIEATRFAERQDEEEQPVEVTP